MTKQEEIRTWLWNKVGYIRKEGSVPSKNKRFMDYDTEEILEYLHSQGVVIKTDKSSSNGMVDVESLIEEE